MKLVDYIEKISLNIIKNKDYLTELDREIGDSDHGINLARGCEKILEELPNIKSLPTSEIFNKIAFCLISNVGGASGALYGTAFMKASIFLKDKGNISPTIIADTWKVMIEGIIERGKSGIGEKTMLDTLIPAYEEFNKNISNGDELSDAFSKCLNKGKEGMENSKNIIATKGRASYLGERSIGHLDPGSMSSYIILETINELLKG